MSFCGHKSAVSCLKYDSGNQNLASGGKVCCNVSLLVVHEQTEGNTTEATSKVLKTFKLS